ncbi:dolichol-phosphate mannosyltransferase [Mariprofundus ferrinatatus]|uniref:Dolichol-phosphate mannosyltransferase n=1 Tax=Mariprofundus ferrinatatus TaxID=1921087 RepID=A0A2K8L3Z7_9PROT|nr:glycosyltransferase family 2 protein [Mariprofundus ferrinatatus]ATX82055.1 dolichol-phosphate mannosyltransferase [Mariprofundus ferrinatatus]
MAHISVVIPVYKAEGCLHELQRRLTASLTKISEDFECLLIEDCGGDRSWEIIQQIASEDSRFKGVQFSRNFGQHYGITAGLDISSGDWTVVMDCDLQDPPEAIPALYAKAQEGFEVVLAQRINRKDDAGKTLSSRIFYRLFNYLTGMEYDPKVGNFRIMSAKVVNNCRNMREGLRFLPGMVEWIGFPAAKVEVEHGSRYAGESTYTFRKLLSLATDTIIAYSDKPLRLSIKLGFSIAGLAFIAGIALMVYAIFYDTPIMGWSSLIVSLYFLGGIIIANLGIVGIYLGKTFDETKNRPLYIINHTTFNHE